MHVTMRPIGVVRTKAGNEPRHCRLSQEEGVLDIEKQYADGLADIHLG